LFIGITLLFDAGHIAFSPPRLGSRRNTEAAMEPLMQDLVKRASELAARLKARNHTVAVAESSTGGMLSAALLAVPGASGYFIGGAVVYTRASRRVLLGITDEAMAGMRPSTEAYALLVARTARDKFATTWALGETGAAGPTGNRYGDASGHSCVAVAGPVERAITIETGSTDRFANMVAFTAAALDLLMQAIEAAQ
jgi:nicotinamide-nucleotide amidase